MTERVVITVLGGVADIHEKPKDIEVVIVDYDNLNGGNGTGNEDCPCKDGPDDCDVCRDPEHPARKGGAR